MIRALRRRFILCAMLALAILLLLMNCGVIAGSYFQMERRWDQTLERLMEMPDMGARPEPPMENPREPKEKLALFGYEIPAHGPQEAYYLVRVDADGGMEVDARGVAEPDEAALREVIDEILASGEAEGKADMYKFALRRMEDGGALVALLDNSAPLQALLGMLGPMMIANALGLLGMFLILLPLSKRMVRSYAVNIEKQKQFITNAGHEIKTPVAIIQSNIDAMELIQGENKWSRNIRGQVTRLRALLNDLLALARLDEGRAEQERTQVELGALVAEEIEAERERCAARGLRLRSEIGEEVRLRGDSRGLGQLVHALLDNAVQYADAGGWIEVRLEKSSRRVRLTLRNSVSRLPDCPPERLFERFYRGDSARTQGTAGCGVGLSAAQSIVEAHKGRIALSYEDAHTLRVSVELPI